MNWKKLFSFWRAPAGAALYKNFDRKLVSHARGRIFPSWTQLKYTGQFLNQWEKRLMWGALLLIVAAGTMRLSVYIKQNLVSAPKAGGEYIEAMVGQPKYLNPLFASTNDVDADIVSLTHSGLFHYTDQQKLVPNLAASFNLSDDKKVYLVSLRQDVSWSDGEKFTADDVIFTVETIQNPEVGSPLLPSFQGVTVEKVGDFAVRFILKEPFAPFLNTLAVGIIPAHIWADITPAGIKLARNNIQPIGTGPWVFDKLVKNDSGNIQSYTLKRNDRYYQKIPYLKTLTFKFYSDYGQAIDALRGQNVDAVSFVPKKFREKIAGKNLIAYQLFLPQYTALFFNPNQQINLKDADLRLALARGIDKNKIIQEALNGEGQIINSPLLPGNLGYYPEIKTVTSSVDAANQLLDKKWKRIQPEEYFKIRSEALLKDYRAEIDAVKKNPSSTPAMVSSTLERINAAIAQTVRTEMKTEQTFYRSDKSGNILSLTLTTADTPEYERAAKTIAGMWNALGIQINRRIVVGRQINKDAIRERDYQILLYAEIVGSDPDLYPFWHSSQISYPGLNLAMFVNRAADKILEDARLNASNAERTKLYKQFQDILAKDLPAIFLYTPTYTFVANKKIQGIKVKNIFSPADRYNDLGNWYIKTKWQWKSS